MAVSASHALHLRNVKMEQTYSKVLNRNLNAASLGAERKYDMSTQIDEHAARELELYMENDEPIYRQRIMPIEENLKKKIKRGNYSLGLSVKLWMYAVDDAAKKYTKEFGSEGLPWNKQFPKPVRLYVATRAAIQFALDNGQEVSKHDQKAVGF